MQKPPRDQQYGDTYEFELWADALDFGPEDSDNLWDFIEDLLERD
jgi:hypothetical protein